MTPAERLAYKIRVLDDGYVTQEEAAAKLQRAFEVIRCLERDRVLSLMPQCSKDRNRDCECSLHEWRRRILKGPA